jgi:hypothetical protein
MAVLSELWTLSPDVRLGQLMAHLGFLAEVHVGKGLGYIDDDELVAVMVRHKTELIARLQNGPAATTPTSGAPISLSGSPTTPHPVLPGELTQ